MASMNLYIKIHLYVRQVNTNIGRITASVLHVLLLLLVKILFEKWTTVIVKTLGLESL